MFPNLAYTGRHERENINPEGITYRFLILLAEMGFNRETEGSQLPPEVNGVPYPFSAAASARLMNNANVPDLFLEG